MIVTLGFFSSDRDFYLFVRTTSYGCILLSLYVDDMIIPFTCVEWIGDLKLQLTNQLELKELKSLCYFLEIQVYYFPSDYLLSQYKYISNIFEHARLADTRLVDRPLELNVKYASYDCVPQIDPTLYRTLIDNLIYLTNTKVVISYDVQVVKHFVVSPLQYIVELFFISFIISREPNFRGFYFPYHLYWSKSIGVWYPYKGRGYLEALVCL